ncbi:MAG: hypothetical protein H0W72_00720 [Planctomycetes bacterium]|nr:hypothetical protein [Planctomycetota bacterium]
MKPQVIIQSDGPVLHFPGKQIAKGSTQRKPKEDRPYEIDVFRRTDRDGYAMAIRYVTKHLHIEKNRTWAFEAPNGEDLAGALATWVRDHNWTPPMVEHGDGRHDHRASREAAALRSSFEEQVAKVLTDPSIDGSLLCHWPDFHYERINHGN